MIFSTLRSLRKSLRQRLNGKTGTRLPRRPLPLRMETLEDRRTPATLFALTTANRLLTFDSATPGTIANDIAVTGLDGANLVGIDYRPLTNELFALGSTSHLYTINKGTGVATDLGEITTLVGTSFGFDFNPTNDRVRIISSTGQSLAITLATPPTSKLNGSINGATTFLNGAAYSNNFAGAPSTTLFGINATTDSLYSIADPSIGTTVLVGALGFDSTDQIGFDINPDDGVAFATLTNSATSLSSLYTINLATGAATLVGQVGGSVALVGLSVNSELNNPPVVVVVSTGATIKAGSTTPVTIDPTINLTDRDSDDFSGGSLTVAITTNGAATDDLTIPSVGDGVNQFKVAGSDIFFGGTLIGTFAGGLAGTNLVVSFNAAGATSTVQLLARSIQFGENSIAPALNTRTVTFTAVDGDGGINSGKSGGSQAAAKVTIADQTAPTATSITLQNSNPTNAASVDFLVTFSENVTGVEATDFILLPTVTGAKITNVVYDSATFTAKVTVSSIAGDGMLQLNLIDDDSIADAAGNRLGGAGLLNGDKSSTPYTIDQTRPVVTSIVRANSNPVSGGPVAYTVTFSENVANLDATDFKLTPTGTVINLGSSLTGMGSVYTFTVTGLSGNGTLRLDFLDDDTVLDAAGNPVGGTGLGNGDFKTGETYTVDTTAPTISSIARLGSNPTNAAPVSFTVTFSESVTGVDAADFLASKTGTITGATVGTVTGSGAVYVVTVTGFTGEGTVQLDFVDDDSVIDAAGNAAGGKGLGNANFNTGQAFTIDTTIPAVTSSVRADADPTKGGTVNFTVTFSEAVTGVNAADFKLTTTGVVGAAVTTVTGSGTTYNVAVSTGTGNGTIRLDVLDDDSIVDLATNPLGGAGAGNGGFTTGQSYTVDLPPVVLSIVRNNPNPTKAAMVDYTVTFSEDVTGVDTLDFGLTLAGALVGVSIQAVSGSGSVYIVTVGTGMGSGDGTIRIDLMANGTITDATMNKLTASFMAGEAYNIDRSAPTVQSFDRVAAVSNGNGADFNIAFNEAVLGVDPTDFTIVRTGTVAGGTVTVTGTGLTRVVTVSGLTGEGTVSLMLVDDDSITDVALNPLGGVGAANGNATSAQSTAIDQTPPTSKIDQATGQLDPAALQPVNFTVTFSELVTGFDKTDIVLGGPAGQTATTVVVTTTDSITFNVAVSGATVAGAITISFLAGAAQDAAANPSVLPTIIDNSVTLSANAAPTVTTKTTATGKEDTNLVFNGANLITIADADAGTDAVEITLTAGKGVLTLSKLTGLTFITGDGTSDAVMKFTGKISDINAALDGLIFKGDSNVNGAASLAIHADDLGKNGIGGAKVGDATVTIDLAAVNDAPSVTAPAAITIAENKTVTFSGANVISVADIDLNGGMIQVTLSGANGKFALASTTGITINPGTDPDGPTITFKGLLADVNNALNGAMFIPTAEFNGTVAITTTADDLSETATATGTAPTALTITPVNSAPVIAGPTPLPITILEDKSFAFTGAGNLLTITDADAGTGALKVSLAVGKGTLTLTGATATGVPGLTFTTGDGTGDASMTFTGTLAAINAALLGSKYDPTANFNGADSLTVNVDDQGNTGGTSMTDSKTFAITVTAVNDAPVAVNDSFTTTQNQSITIPAPGLVANDTDPEGTALSVMQIGTLSPNKGTLQLSQNGSFVFTPQANFVGTVTFQYQATDGLLNSNTATVTITITENFRRLHATGAGAGAAPHVQVYSEDGTVLASFLAFDEAFTGGVAVATGDVDGDGVEDIIVGAGFGGCPHVRVLSGADLHQIMSFYAFDVQFTGGVSVAAGDVDGDGRSDVIVGAGPTGGPHVRVFSGATGQIIQQFFAYNAAFSGGVDVAAGDYDGDGFADIVTGAGPGGGPHVIVYKGMAGETILRSFYAFDPAFTGGVEVAAGEFQGRAAIYAAAGPGGVPVVQVFDFNSATAISSFMAFDESVRSGVHIGTEVNFDGTTTLFLGAGNGSTPNFRTLSTDNLLELRNINAYDPGFLGGVFVG